MPSRRVTAATATASGGDTIAPSTKADGQGSAGTSACATAATAAIVTRTRPTESSEIERRCHRKSRQDVLKADQYSRGGMKTRKMTSGESVARGSSGMNASSVPPSTSRTGEGTTSRSASWLITAVAASSTRTSSSAFTSREVSAGAAVGSRSRVSLQFLIERYSGTPLLEDSSNEARDFGDGRVGRLASAVDATDGAGHRMRQVPAPAERAGFVAAPGHVRRQRVQTGSRALAYEVDHDLRAGARADLVAGPHASVAHG